MQVLLPLAMQHQAQTEWCWAAVSASVGDFLGWSEPPGTRTQCDIANSLLGLADCCGNGSSDECNRTTLLDVALELVGHKNGDPYEGTASFDSIVQLTSEFKVPIGVRVDIGGDGHFLLIVGFNNDNGNQWVRVADPIYGPNSYDYTEFCRAYQGGQWTHTYPIA
jgi:Papain-like cysteine protease AvrRpt2